MQLVTLDPGTAGNMDGAIGPDGLVWKPIAGISATMNLLGTKMIPILKRRTSFKTLL
jgi:hypothetical protein